MAESPKGSRLLIDISTGSIVRVLIVLLVLGVLFLMRDLIALLFIAVILAAGLSPTVDGFTRRKVPRTLVVVVLYLLLIALISAFVYFVLPPVIVQLRQLTNQLPGYFDALNNFLKNLQLVSGIETKAIQPVTDIVSRLLQNIFATTVGVFGGVVAFATVLILTLYLLLEEDGIKKFFLSIVPLRQKSRITRVANRIGSKLGGWLRGQFLLALLVGLTVYLGLLLLKIPYALTLGLIAGVLEIVPIIGPILAAIPAIIIAFTISPMMALVTTVFYVLVQEVENKVLVPKVMQHAVGFNPVTIIILLLIGVKLMGILGLLLALPVALVIYVVLEEWLIFGEPAEKK